MKTIAVAGPKGGVGKSSVTSALAVRATLDVGKVAMIDLNLDQGTLSEWWTLRGRPVNPYLYDDEGMLDEMIDGLRADNWDYCFIDGPPMDQDIIEMSILVADAVLVPLKLSYFDTSAIDSIVGMCRRRKKPFRFVINEFDDRRAFDNANAIALTMLEGRGEIAKQRISYDPKHRVGQIKGQTGAEISKPLAKEIDALWSEVKKLLSVTPSLKVVEGDRG